MDEQQHDEKLDHEVENAEQPQVVIVDTEQVDTTPVYTSDVDTNEEPVGDNPATAAAQSQDQPTGSSPTPAPMLLRSMSFPPPRPPTRAEVMIGLLREGDRSAEPTGLERLRMEHRMRMNGHADH